MTGWRGIFELSAENTDKANVSEEEMIHRASMIRDIPVALTHSPRFIQKAILFPNTTFVLGYDTAERLVRDIQIEDGAQFQALETHFLVADRQFQGLEDLELSPESRSMFKAIPKTEFYEEISSTELRTL